MTEDFDTKFDHFDKTRKDEGLSTVWSIYEVSDLYSEHPFTNATEICYHQNDSWGQTVVRKIVDSSNRTDRWIDLYRAANFCINNSGDNHHVYIEQFIPSSIDSKVLFLTTGS
jgi:hypothetical protein